MHISSILKITSPRINGLPWYVSMVVAGTSVNHPLCFDYCEHFASLGMVGISAQYRLAPMQQVTPLESLADAKSMIRWLRENAGELCIDPERIVACGFSAGGQLASGTAILEGFEEQNENLAVSSVPDAVGLWYSCVNTVYDSWFNMLCKHRIDPTTMSPMHNVKPGLPPTIIFQGTEDTAVPVWAHRKFSKRMKEEGNICELVEFEGRPHSFTSIDPADRRVTMEMMETFLNSLGYGLGDK